MPVTLNFPTLPSGMVADSAKFSTDLADNAIRDETEGGYTITRARSTRMPRRSWKLGYTFSTNADKNTIEDFWKLTLGTSRIFNWTDPESLIVYQVRFKGTISSKYVGKGPLHRWDCDFELEQA